MVYQRYFFFTHPLRKGNKKPPSSFEDEGSESSGDKIRTCDLWVMSPTSYPCSTPQYFKSQIYVLFPYRKDKIFSLKTKTILWSLTADNLYCLVFKGEKKLISQGLQHGFKRLFFCKKFCGNLSVLIAVNQHMFGRGNQAVLNSSVTCNGFLVSSCVKKSYV